MLNGARFGGSDPGKRRLKMRVDGLHEGELVDLSLSVASQVIRDYQDLSRCSI
jgi:hypothetical protein